MARYVVFLAVISFAAIMVSDRISINGDNGQLVATTPVQTGAQAVERNQATSAQPIRLSGTERLRADARGHYVAEFRLNNMRVQAMIDTGATTVAINESTARRAGVQLSRSDFIHPVDTANGRVMAARAMLDEVRIGAVRVRDVEALVLDDRALGTVLIGMSFMGRLRGFSHENGTLVLRR